MFKAVLPLNAPQREEVGRGLWSIGGRGMPAITVYNCWGKHLKFSWCVFGIGSGTKQLLHSTTQHSTIHLRCCSHINACASFVESDQQHRTLISPLPPVGMYPLCSAPVHTSNNISTPTQLSMFACKQATIKISQFLTEQRTLINCEKHKKQRVKTRKLFFTFESYSGTSKLLKEN